MSQGFTTQRALIEDLVAEGNLEGVNAKVNLLLDAIPARTPLEKAEAYLVGGWALAVHLVDGWEALLNKAIFSYAPESPAKVWARWLLGGIQWGIPSKRGEAANNWRIALSELSHLKERAEWYNQQLAVNTFVEKLTAMQAALEKQRNNLA